MRTQDAFSKCHPAVNFCYFALVLVCSMFLMHPVCLGVSLFCAVCYTVSLYGGRGLRARLSYLVPMMLLAAILNPAFNHQGITTLARLPSGNPLTLESILYGVAAAVMLAAVVLWLACFSAVMTSDKTVCLFGRVAPALSLILTMSLRFIPRFRSQFRAVRDAQRCLGEDTGAGKRPFARLSSAVTALSAVLTWSLEDGVDTADSMRSRGYGLPGRSFFALYRFDRRDGWTMAWLLACGGSILAGWVAGGFGWRYFPSVKGSGMTPLSVCLFTAYFALCLTPLVINGYDALLWRRARRREAVA